jgi:hypothetical protein
MITPKSAFARLKALVDQIRREGVAATAKSVGWKVIAAVFVYYLVRDVTLYILIPYWFAKRISDS